MKVHYYNLDQGVVLQPISLEFRSCPSNPDTEVSRPKRSRFSNVFLGFLLLSVPRSIALEYPHTRNLVMQFHDWLMKWVTSSRGTSSPLPVCTCHLWMSSSNYVTKLDLETNLSVLLKEFFRFLFWHWFVQYFILIRNHSMVMFLVPPEDGP